MRKILLTQGKYALVDDADFERLNKWKWHFSHGYAQRTVNRKKIYMHRIISKAKFGEIVDHVNRNKLNNQKRNLRIVDKAGNQRNHKLFSHNTSGYNGISWSKVMKRWEVYIWKLNKKINLGYFSNIKKAYKIRLQAEKLYW